MSKKVRRFYGTIHPERATNEWQRENALPDFYRLTAPAKQIRIAERCEVSDSECAEMRRIYAAFPPHLIFVKVQPRPDEWLLAAWKEWQDEAVREALWLAEQMGGAYKGRRDEFLADWAADEYELEGALIFPAEVLEIEGEVT